MGHALLASYRSSRRDIRLFDWPRLRPVFSVAKTKRELAALQTIDEVYTALATGVSAFTCVFRGR